MSSPSGKVRHQGPAGYDPPTQVPDLGSGSEPPPPPSLDGDPRPHIPPKSGPKKGRISPDFWGLRCNVQGGWGGSAHYPDPTAQSAERLGRPTRRRRARPSGAGLPDLRGKTSQKRKKIFCRGCGELGAVMVRGWGVATACGSVSHGRSRFARLRPCPTGGGPDGQAGGVRFPEHDGRILRTCGALPHLTGDTVRWSTFGYRKRPPLSLSPHGAARTSVLAMREVLFRQPRTTHWP